MTTSNVAANIICDDILNKYNRYAYIFNATRVNPIKNRAEFKNMFLEQLILIALNKIKDSNLSLDNISNNSGGIIDVNNQKVGIYKDSSR